MAITVAMPDISANGGHLQSTEVPWVWPKDTDLCNSGNGRLFLQDQTPIVRATIMEAFKLLHASVMFKNTFPDHLLTNKFIEEALSTAALLIPTVADVHVCVLQDRVYCSEMSTLVCVCVLPCTSLTEEFSHELKSASSMQRSRSAALSLLRPCSACLTHQL